jgi:hypothetical protein
MLVKTTAVSSEALVLAGTLAAVAAATVALSWPSFKKKHKKPTKWQLWIARTVGMNAFVLKHVKVPIAVMPTLDSSVIVDQEGLVECNILVKNGRIAQVATDPFLCRHLR